MSAQKFLVDADKLLEKGKTAEAVAKIKSAVAAEPSNQLIVTKLAELYLTLGKVAEAVQAYVQLAERLSDSGKSQVAVAVYKKALEIIPTDSNLRAKFILECERAGKLGEAYAGAQDLLSYFLPRKKYFEALNIFVIIYRVQARDPHFRGLWLDLLLKTQSEQKLIHFLVALFGPPGIASPEIPTGGDPLEMSADFYQRCKEIIYWFPRDAKAAYGLAWAAYKRSDTKEAYRFLRECIRRDPDYTLGYLLFARILSENKFLNECMYVYQQAKDSLSIDHSGEPHLISQQVEGFIEKNGWLSFAVGVDTGDMTPEQFLKTIKGEEGVGNEESETKLIGRAGFSNSGLAGGDYDPIKELNIPAEIELSLGSNSEDSFEIESNRSEKENKTIVSSGKSQGNDDEDSSVNLTSVIKVNPEELRAKPSIDTELAKEIIAKVEEVISSTSAASKRQFNPMEEMASVENASGLPERDTGTIQYSPLDTIHAANFHQQRLEKSSLAPPMPPELPVEPPVFVDGDKTVLFSPIGAVSLPTEEKAGGAEEDGKTLIEKLEAIAPEQGLNQEVPIAAEVPIIEQASIEIIGEPVFEESSLDMGTDLLEEPTRILVRKEDLIPDHNHIESTSEPKIEANAEPQEVDNSVIVLGLMERSQKYLVKKNYYLARRALHNARLLGADDELIKSKLKEVRLAEMPNGMYAAISNDDRATNTKISPEDTALFDYLELSDESIKLSQKGNQEAKAAIEALVHSVDPKSLMDLGIGFFEMGLYEGAEKLFEKIIEAEPSEAFNVYYLMGQAAMSRGDHARAVSIFKKLAADHTRTEQEKISIYYSLGEALEKMDQTGRSKSYFEKVAELDANYRNVKEKING